jgi:hypothetical protein
MREDRGMIRTRAPLLVPGALIAWTMITGCQLERPPLPPDPKDLPHYFNVTNPEEADYCRVMARATEYIGKQVRLSGTYDRQGDYGHYMTGVGCDDTRTVILVLPKETREWSRPVILQFFEAFRNGAGAQSRRRVTLVGTLESGRSFTDLGPVPYVLVVVGVEFIDQGTS